MRDYPQSAGWIAAGVIAVVLVVGLMLYSASTDQTTSASKQPSETTGLSERPPTMPTNP
jgi:hypothetical protein